MALPGISDSLIAALFYSAGKKIIGEIWDGFNTPLRGALDDTAVYFSKERGIEIETEGFRAILEGDVGKDEINKFRDGDSFIDTDDLALQFAIYSGFYLEDESKILEFGKEILAYFNNAFEHRLLSNQKTASQALYALQKIQHKISQLERKEILHAVEGLIDNKNPPLDLPRRPDNFIGRDILVERLVNDLQPGRVVSLCGPGGIGKSALAAEAVWRLTPDNKPPKRFPNGIIHHDFYREPRVSQFFDQIARRFGVDPNPSPLAAAKRALSGKRALLILDGAENADDLHLILSITAGCGVLVTSRNKGDAIVSREDLTPLSPADSVSLLTACAKGMLTDQTMAQRICEFLGGLPLALQLAGSYMEQSRWTADEYLTWLEESPLKALDRGKHRIKSVNILLKRSFDQVGESAQKALGVVGLLALSPFQAEAVAAALGISPAEIKRTLGKLVRYSLLARPGERYEVSHALIHTYASGNCDSPPVVVALLSSYYSQFAEEQCALGPAGYSRLDVERPHLMRLLDACKGHGLFSEISSLAWAIDGYLDIQGHWQDRITTLEMAASAAVKLGNQRDEVGFIGNLGNAYRDLGQIEKAIGYYEQALNISQKIGDRQGEGTRLGSLGNAYSDLGQVEKAIGYYEQALVISREIGNRRGEGSWLGDLGLSYSDLGQVEKAIGYYEQALAITWEIGDRRSEGTWLGSLGNAYRALGHVEKAIDYHEQALAITREIGNRRGEGTRLGSLGNAYSALGQVEKAIDYYEQALAITREIGDRRGEGTWLGNLGSAYSIIGHVEKAIDYHEQALAITWETCHRQGEGIILGNLGSAYRVLGQVEKAIDYHQQALATSREIGHRQSEGRHLGNLGSAYSALGQVEKAIDYYEQALAITREIGDRQDEGSASGNLGLAYRTLGQVERAKKYFKESFLIFEEIKSPQAPLVKEWLEEIEK